MTSEFKTTGSAELRAQIAALPEDMLEPKQRLEKLVRQDIAGKEFSELTTVTYDHDGATLSGHALLDELETAGFSVDDYDAVGAMTVAAIPLVSALIHAAASRGQNLDGFVMDFVFPGIKGPSIHGKKVILIDAWLSEKSFVQTSSVVTLTHGNELNLDFAVLENEGATVLAIASLVGSVGELSHCDSSDSCCGGHSDNDSLDSDERHSCSGQCGGDCCDDEHGEDSAMTITLVNPITEKRISVPFIPLFSDKELQ